MTTTTENQPSTSSDLLQVDNLIPRLAHDLKKPFSLITMGMELIDQAQDLTAVKNVTQVVKGDLEKAQERVQRMLGYLMALSDNQYVFERSSLGEILEDAVNQLQQHHHVQFDPGEADGLDLWGSFDGQKLQDAMRSLGVWLIEQSQSPLTINLEQGDDGKVFIRFHWKGDAGDALADLFAAPKKNIDWQDLSLIATRHSLARHNAEIRWHGSGLSLAFAL